MLIIKGIIIGIGKIIPGVSGSMLAISLGIYQNLIDSINNFFDNPIKSLKYLIKIFVGISLSIILFSKIIINLLNNNYLITMLFFIGLIIGSISDIKKQIITKSYITHIIFIVVVILGLINVNNNIIINKNFIGILILFICGFIDAVTMVVPGISGTATLMMIGIYNTIMHSISSVLDFKYINNNMFILIPFLLGMIVGTFITTKIVDYLFKHHLNKTYSAILGFSCSTIFLMLIRALNSKYNIYEFIIGIVFLLLGIFVSKKINQIND